MPHDSTKSVHGTERADESTGSVITPIYQTSTFGFKKARDISRAARGETNGFVYSRWDNPTVRVLEEKLADLEGAEEAAFFSSGMAAISTAIIACVKKGDHVLAIRDLYGETYRLMDEFLPSFGVETSLVDSTDTSSMAREVRSTTKVVYVETPTNPTLKLVDLKKAARVAHGVGALLLVDNTFASPLSQKPLSLGADLVLHSATKFLSGHSDVIAGAVAGRKEQVRRIKRLRRTLGGTLDPHAAFLVLRGIKTLALRIEKHNENAQELAEYLESHEKVSRVNYPGLKTHPQHNLARRQMSGYGGMLSFEVKGTMKDAVKFTESLEVATLGASLGSVETLVTHPATLTHLQMSSEERERTGISGTLIRVAVGIEDSEDIIDDFARALAKV